MFKSWLKFIYLYLYKEICGSVDQKTKTSGFGYHMAVKNSMIMHMVLLRTSCIYTELACISTYPNLP